MLGGAVISGIADGILDVLGEDYAGTFPFTKTIDPLPTADKIILAGVAGSVRLLAPNKVVENLGNGMLAYSVPMVVARTIANAASPSVALRAGLPRGRTAPKMIPGVLMPKYQLGNGISLGGKASLAGGTYPGAYSYDRPGLGGIVGAREAINVGPYAGGITAPKFIPGPLRPKYTHGS